MSLNLPFDRVELRDGTAVSTLTPSEYMALPLSQRIRAVIERRVRFFAGRTELAGDAALDAMRKLHAAA